MTGAWGAHVYSTASLAAFAFRIAAWAMSQAEAGVGLVTSTVRDLVAGSGIDFEELRSARKHVAVRGAPPAVQAEQQHAIAHGERQKRGHAQQLRTVHSLGRARLVNHACKRWLSTSQMRLR